MEKVIHTNRLISEKSPYLLQHAHNPVNWYPWGLEAFHSADKMNKPIFLSIGYAACHWCHVMEKESFDDMETSQYLNDTFICIKVDREERPDIDALYMSACQILTGSGGWPLTILMTPNKIPFFAGTYIPKHSRFGRIGLIDLCIRVNHLWKTDKQKIIDAADQVLQSLKQYFYYTPSSEPDMSILDQCYHLLKNSFDSEYGGFGAAPKFPTPHRILFLLRHYQRTGEKFSLEMVKKTLTAMRYGGIWDHVGFGFHRYSTDNQWLLPHFEKMLYDQALLASTYLQAYEITKDFLFSQTADEIFKYVLRDLRSPEGGFYSAEDADSEGEEGKFYVWKADEFKKAIGDYEASFWASILHVNETGNYSDEASRIQTGNNILFLGNSLEHHAKTYGVSIDRLYSDFESIRLKLFESRLKRVRPLKDDKILSDWNGLMIASLAIGGKILDNKSYTLAAEKASHFIFESMMDTSGKLYHRYRNGDASIESNACDYAYLIMGFIELYATTTNSFWLKKAVELQSQMIDEFWDSGSGGFFLIRSNSKDLPVLPKDIYDGALPSANSVSFHNLLRLSQITGNPLWKQKAQELLCTFSDTIRSNPTLYTFALTALDLYYG